MSQEQIDPTRIDDATSAPEGVAGTTEGEPTAGRELPPEDHEEAVEPDNNAFEVDGPQAGHA